MSKQVSKYSKYSKHTYLLQEEDAFRAVMVPQHAAGVPARCTLRVEVLPTSASGEHELKLYGLTLQDAGSFPQFSTAALRTRLGLA